VSTLLLERYGWRSAFFVPALFVSGAAVAVGIGLRDRDEAGSAKRTDDAPAEVPRAGSVLGAVLRSPLVWALGTSYFFMKLLRYAMWNWLPVYMHESLHYSTRWAGFLSPVFDIGGVSGALLAGWASDRFFPGRRVPIAIVGLMLVAALLPLYGHLAPRHMTLNVACLALVGLCLAGPDMLVSGPAAQDIGGRKGAAVAAGIINGLGSIGQILAGPVAPLVSLRTGGSWQVLFALLGGGAALSAIILLPFANRRAQAAAANAGNGAK
jgi:sugar phosphate permease